MADFMINDALGTLKERMAVGLDDIIVVPMSAVAADATNKDGYAGGTTLANYLGAAGNTEQTGSTWDRKVHANAAITVTIDDSGDKVIVILDSDDVWTGPAAANDVVALLICIDGASDAARLVHSQHDFVVVTDGNDVNADYDQVNGVWQSS